MGFDLATALAEPPAAYAVIRPDSPSREVWSRFFADDHVPLLAGRVFRERGFQGSVICTVLVSVDHMDAAGLDRLVTAFTAGGGWSAEEQDRLKGTFRQLGVYEMVVREGEVVAAPTLALGRLLAGSARVSEAN